MANIFELLLAQIRREERKIAYTVSPGKSGVPQGATGYQGKTVRQSTTMQQGATKVPAAEDSGKGIETKELKVQKVCQDMHEITGREVERVDETVDKEDFLLSQIDEFREKAKQLQRLLLSKESKVQELQSLVNERQDKAEELEQILSARQEEADQIMKDFNQKVDELSAKVTHKMTEIEASISHQVTQAKNASVAQLEANRKLNEEQMEANKKLSEEQLSKNKQFLEEQAIANKKLSEGQIAEVKVLLDAATTQLESIKTDLSEKVHSENVKCYRNIQDLFTEFDSKIEKMDEMEKGVGAIRGYVKCLTWFSILNFVVLIGFILYSLGIFNF